MAKLCINDKLKCNGTMDFTLVETESRVVECHGRMVTHRYIEELNSIESDRYKLEKITVYKETFSTGDYNIMYEFKAAKWTIDQMLEHLEDEDRLRIERDMYEHEKEEEPFHKYLIEKEKKNE